MPPVTDRVIAGRYNLLEPIGRGAMGVVWRARDRLLDRYVAIKEVVLDASIDSEERDNAYKRTLREARTAARLSHPGVVTVFDVAEEDGRPWIVMEFVPSRSLEAVLAEDGPLTPRRACRIGQQILNALATAHAAGVLHRDVKPSNVLIATDTTGMGQRAVLTDFGIAQFQGDPRLTQTGMVMGSPGFTAPERIRGGSATPASDLWSLGATLYAAIEGVGPYDERGGPITTMSAIINEDAPPAASAGPLGPVIASLLRRNPAGRPSAQVAARMFTQVLPLLPDRPARRRPPAPTVPSAVAEVPDQPRPVSAKPRPVSAKPRAVSATAEDKAEPETPQEKAAPAESKGAAADGKAAAADGKAAPAEGKTTPASDTAGDDEAAVAHEAVADEAAPGETAADEDKPADGKKAPDGTKAPDAESAAAADTEACEAESAGKQAAEAGSPQDEAADTEPATDEPVGNEPAGDESVGDGPAASDETPEDEEAPEGKAADDEPAANESAEPKSADAESAEPESAGAKADEAEAVKAEAVKAEATGGVAADDEKDADEPVSTPADADAHADPAVQAASSAPADHDTPADDSPALDTLASDAAPADSVVAANESAPEPLPAVAPDLALLDAPRVPPQPGLVFSANWSPPRLDPPTKPQPEFPAAAAPGYRPAGYGPPSYGSSDYGAPNYSGPGYNPGGYRPDGYAPAGYNPRGGYGPGGHRAGTKRARQGRLATLVLAMVVVAAGIGVAIALLIRPGQATSKTAGGTTSGISTPTTSATPASAQVPAAVRAVDAPAAAPADWTTRTVLPSVTGTTSGFTIGEPSDWQLKRRQLASYLESPSGTTYADVDLTQHKYTDMMAEAQYIERQAATQGRFPDYRRISMQPVSIRGAAGAFWSFTWTQPDGVTMEVEDLLFTLDSQSYAIDIAAPSADFGTNATQTVFNEILRTFQPVLSG